MRGGRQLLGLAVAIALTLGLGCARPGGPPPAPTPPAAAPQAARPAPASDLGLEGDPTGRWEQSMARFDVSLLRGDLPEARAELLVAVGLALEFDEVDVRIDRTTQAIDSLVWAHLEQQRGEEAISLLRAVEAEAERGGASRHELALHALERRGRLHLEQGDPASAEAAFRAFVERGAARRGDEDLSVAGGQVRLASALALQGRVDDAHALLQRALENRRAKPDDPEMLEARLLLGTLEAQRWRLQRAIEVLEEVGRLAADKGPVATPVAAAAAAGLGQAQLSAGDLDAARAAFQQAETAVRRMQPPPAGLVAQILSGLGSLARARGELGRALELHTQALEQAENRLGEHHGETAAVRIELAASHQVAGNPDRARELVERVGPLLERSGALPLTEAIELRSRLSEIEARIGQPRAALRHSDEATREAARIYGPSSPAVAVHRARRALARLEAGKRGPAAQDADAAVQALARHFGAEHVLTAGAVATVARLWAGEGRPDEAIALFEQALAALERAYGQRSPRVADLLEERAQALRSAGRAGAAERDAQRAADLRGGYRRAWLAGTAAAELPQFNFRVTPTDPAWRPLDPARVSPTTRVAYYRANPEVVFAVIVEPTTPGLEYSPELLKQAVKRTFEASIDAVELVEERQRSLAGIDGPELSFRLVVGGVPQHLVIWFGVHGGWAYQLMTFARQRGVSERQLAHLSDQMLGSFSLIDREARPAASAGGPYFVSDRFGYTVDLREGGWRPWRNLAQDQPHAEFGALHPSGAVLLVLPVSLLGTQAGERVVLEALLSMLDEGWPQTPRRLRIGELRGIEADSTRFSSEAVYKARLRALKGADAAYLVLAMADQRLGEEASRFLAAIEAVSFDPEPPGPIEARSLAQRERMRHAHVFNGIGLAHQRIGNRGQAIRFLDLARELVPDDLALLQNLVYVQVEAGRYAEAIEALQGGPERFSERIELLAYRAFARQQTGDHAGAIADYQAAFERGLEDEDFLGSYVELLWQAGERDRAIGTLDAAIAAHGSLSLRARRATLKRLAGAHEEAIEELEAIEAQSPADASALAQLALAYYETGRHAEAVEAWERYEAAFGRSAEILVQKARSEYSLGRYPEAAATVDAALDLEPESGAAQELKSLLAATLGEGDQSLLREPLEQVPFPPELVREAALEGGELARHGAGFLHWVEALHFEPGAPRRRSLHLRVAVADARGADELSTLRFEFEPLWERIWLNQLVVRGASGEVVARKDAASVYVLDEFDDSGVTSSSKVLHVAVPGLEPGAVFDAVVTRKDLGPVERLPLVEHVFSRTLPVAVSAVFVSGETRHLAAWSSPGVTRRELQGGVAWISRAPAPSEWEPMADESLSHLPRLLVGDDRDTWEELARHYAEELAPFLAAELEAGAPPGSIPEQASTPQERTASALRYVQENLSYKALAFGVRARIPHPLQEILENRFGDCKDHSLLLARLLQEAGLPARLALVSLTRPVESSVASLDQFDHMIVHCEGCGDSAFLDATDKDLHSASIVPRGLAGRLALVLDPEQPRLLRIPPYSADRHTVRIERRVAIDPEGGVSVVEDAVLSGHWGASLRGALRTVERGQWKEMLQQQIFDDYRAALLKRLEARHVEDPAEPLGLRLEYEIGGWLSGGGGRLSGRIPALLETAYLRATPIDQRRSPFEILYPLRLHSTARLQAPPGFSIRGQAGEAADAADRPAARYLRFEGSTEARGDAITVSFQAVRTPGRHPAAEYQRYYEEALRALRFFDATLELVPR